MFRSFRYLFQFAWVNLACVLGFAAVVLAGCYVTGVPDGADNIFRTYFGTFPVMCLLILFIFSFALCTSNLNLALSLGARRRDFFCGTQGLLLLYTAVCWGVQCVMAAIPDWFGWASVDRWSMVLSLGGLPAWVYPLLCLMVLTLGGVCGLAFVRSKTLGIVLLVAAMLVSVVVGVLAILVFDGMTGGLWSRLPALLLVGMAVVIAVCEGVLWRTVRRYVVR